MKTAIEKTHPTGTLYCRPEKRGKGLKDKTSDKVCGVCKLRRRGKGHNEGSHHKLVMTRL